MLTRILLVVLVGVGLAPLASGCTVENCSIAPPRTFGGVLAELAGLEPSDTCVVEGPDVQQQSVVETEPSAVCSNPHGNACAACIGSSCCDALSACFADDTCRRVAYCRRGGGADCGTSSLLDAAVSCAQTACADACGGP